MKSVQEKIDLRKKVSAATDETTDLAARIEAKKKQLEQLKSVVEEEEDPWSLTPQEKPKTPKAPATKYIRSFHAFGSSLSQQK